MAWYETFFDENYLKEYARGLTPERAQREADFVGSTLNLPQTTLVVLMAVSSHGIQSG